MNAVGYLQRVSRTLMTPIAVLPAAAIMLRIGSMTVHHPFLMLLCKVFYAGGSAIFDHLPLLFAIGTAVGLAEGAGMAALSAAIGQVVFQNAMNLVGASVNGGNADPHLDMGVLGGILTGIVSALIYNRSQSIKLPESVGFFGGPRFAPIITSLGMALLGLLLGLCWMPVQSAIHVLGNWILSTDGFGMFAFGLLNRLLIPVGLHHILDTIAWFQLGDFQNGMGKIVHGDLTRFFAGDQKAGLFMTGFFPVMMFGLPGACIAMIREANPKQRARVKTMLIPAAFASFLTGITEPIEFSFLFSAPPLFLTHAILTGISMAGTSYLGMHLGFSFSAGFIDYLLNWNLSSRPLLLIPFGIVYFFVYYGVFRIVIRLFHLQTPGREKEAEAISQEGIRQFGREQEINLTAPSSVEGVSASGVSGKAAEILSMIGGPENILDLDACVTRLRLTLVDAELVNDAGLKSLGAAGIVNLGKGNVQIVFGTESELIKEQLKLML